jgi:alkane 1-monooxygenase
MKNTILLFALLSLAPVPLLVLAALNGGIWVWLALGYVTVLSGGVDLLVTRIGRAGEPDDPAGAANTVSVAIALSHFALLPLLVHALTGATGLPLWARAALLVAAGFWFGQTVNANSHELIHRSSRLLHNLGRWVYITMLFGHATSAHLKVHHRWAASPRDPLWPRGEEGFYAIAPRAWVGSFRAGWAAEDAMRAKASGPQGLHPYALYLGGGALVLLAAFGLDGAPGVVALLALAAFSQVQLLLSDYVQHYGLRRAELPGGKLEPMRLAHSWNARHWFTSFMTLNASRHSDHHAHPARPYPALRLPDAQEAPLMPYSLPVMGLIALVPPVWRRMMRHEVAHWEAIRAPSPQAA